MSTRLLPKILALTGVEIRENEEGYAFRVPAKSRLPLISTMGWLLAVAVFAVTSSMFLLSLIRFPYYSPVTNVEEVALFYTSAGNFIKYGFSTSTFLPDYSNSSDAADHPYVYVHMPPGPDIVVALILKTSHGNYRLVRLLFWLTFLAGMVCYFRFTRIILGRFSLAGAGYAVLFLNPWMLLRTMDDPVYATFPMFAFLPLLALETHYRTGSRWHVYLTQALALLASVYLDYLSLLVVIYSWVLLYFTRLIRLSRKHLLALLGTVCFGVLLHQFQNLLYLGPTLFVQEVRMTLANRILGIPSKETMKVFYQSIGVVHHGSTPLNPRAFLHNIGAGFSFPGSGPIELAAVLVVAWVLLRHARHDLEDGSVRLSREATAVVGYFARLTVWIGGTLTLPMLMFPAFTQEYGLHGVGLNAYFLAIAATAVTLEVIKQAVLYGPRQFPRVGANLWPSEVALILILLAGLGLWHATQSSLESFRLVRSDFALTALYTPQAPKKVTATRLSPTTIELSWTRVAGETEYRIETKGDFRTTFTQIAVMGPGTTTARINELAPSKPYSFRIRACYHENCSAYSRVVSDPPVEVDVPTDRSARSSTENQRNLEPPPFKYAKLEEIQRNFRGHIYMTNINPVTVGFFAQEAGYGVCGPASLPEGGDIDVAQCHSFYVRRPDQHARVRPKYFFFFRDLFPGFSDCLPSAIFPALQRGGDECLTTMHNRLAKRFEKVYDNNLFEVFDLNAAKR